MNYTLNLEIISEISLRHDGAQEHFSMIRSYTSIGYIRQLSRYFLTKIHVIFFNIKISNGTNENYLAFIIFMQICRS